MTVRKRNRVTIVLLAGMLGVPGASALGAGGDQPFSTNFDWISGQESFAELPGDVFQNPSGIIPPPTGDGWAYFVPELTVFKYDFDTQFPGTLEITVWDPAWKHTDPATGEENGSVNLRGPRWGAYAHAEWENAEGDPLEGDLVNGAALEYRTFINVNDFYSISPGHTNNPATASSWFTMAFGGGLPRPDEPTWVTWTFDFTDVDVWNASISYDDGTGTIVTGSRDTAWTAGSGLAAMRPDAIAEGFGAEGIYLFGGAPNPTFWAGEDPSVGDVWQRAGDQVAAEGDPNFVFLPDPNQEEPDENAVQHPDTEEWGEWGQWGETILRNPGEDGPGLWVDSIAWTPAEVPEFLLGDMNLDGVVDAVDVSPFVLALTNPAQYEIDFGADLLVVGDINGDGVFDAVDVAPFVQLLVGGGGAVASVPEPGSLALLGLGGLLLLRRRRAA
ncbi:MAG: PEP-CTERM sorting domain-containing protein [Phycisphaeraceae bacterium]